MGLLDDVIEAVSEGFGLAKAFTKSYVEARIRERMHAAIWSAAIQLLIVGIAAALVATGNEGLARRLLVSTIILGLFLYNFLRLLFVTIPDLHDFYGSWKRTWLRLCGISLFHEVVVRSAGSVGAIALLLASRWSLCADIQVVQPWLDLLGIGS